jgi:hypothetical protein
LVGSKGVFAVAGSFNQLQELILSITLQKIDNNKVEAEVACIIATQLTRLKKLYACIALLT